MYTSLINTLLGLINTLLGTKISPSRAILSRWFSSSLLVGYVSSHQESNTSLNIFFNSQRVPSYVRNERRAPSCLGSIKGKSYPTVIIWWLFHIPLLQWSRNHQDFSWTPGPREPRDHGETASARRCGWPSGSCHGYIIRTSEWEPKVVKAGGGSEDGWKDGWSSGVKKAVFFKGFFFFERDYFSKKPHFCSIGNL